MHKNWKGKMYIHKIHAGFQMPIGSRCDQQDTTKDSYSDGIDVINCTTCLKNMEEVLRSTKNTINADLAKVDQRLVDLGYR